VMVVLATLSSGCGDDADERPANPTTSPAAAATAGGGTVDPARRDGGDSGATATGGLIDTPATAPSR